MNYAIVAMDLNNGIGKDGKLPWHFSEDMKFFKTTTEGAICVMGRKTHNEIFDMRKDKSTLLPKRVCYVLTSQDIPHHENGTHLVRSEDELISALENEDKTKIIFFTGGKSIFEKAMDNSDFYVDCFFVTRIKHAYDCDVSLDTTKLEQNFKQVETLFDDNDIQIQKWIRRN